MASYRQRKGPASAVVNPDDYLVDFDGPHDPLYPFNWAQHRSSYDDEDRRSVEFLATVFLSSQDIQTLIICRFFSGLFGASQLSLVPAVLSDILDKVNRGRAIAVYWLAVFGGPFTAPFIGGFIAESQLGWRWTLYVPVFMGFLSTVSMYVLA